LRRYQPTGVRSEVIRVYYQVINTDLKLGDNVRNKTILSVVVPLTEFIKALPQYTRNTRSISANAFRLRNAIANARDPQQLLFHDIPEALGFLADETSGGIMQSKDFKRILWSALSELRDFYSNFLVKLQGQFVIAMSVLSVQISSFSQFRHDLKEKALQLIDICLDNKMGPVLAALANEKVTDEEWFLKVAAIIMEKPVQLWQDNEIEPFIARVEELCERIHQLYEIRQMASRQVHGDNTLLFVSVVRPDGCIACKSIKNSVKQTPEMIEIIKTIDINNKEMRIGLLSYLLKTMEKEGDF
jgi:hypothetical protein